MLIAQSLLEPLLGWFQSTAIANTVAQSLLLTGFLSSVHLVGLMLVVGSALVSSLRLLGLALPETPVASVAVPAGRVIVTGLTISVITGLLLVAPRASYVLENNFFRTKMLLLVAAVLVHATLFRRVTRQRDPRQALLKATGALGLGLWGGVAAFGCAYILLEY